MVPQDARNDEEQPATSQKQPGQPQQLKEQTAQYPSPELGTPVKTNKSKNRVWITLRRIADMAAPEPSMESGITVGAQTHQLPPGVMWRIVATISVGVAATNFGIVLASYYLMEWKFRFMQAAIDSAGLWAGVLVLMACCAGVAAVGSTLVVLFAPVCSGGGLPEMKGYLNGNKTNGLMRGRNFVVRFFGTIASVVAGFPIGREGPTISLGCNVGYGVVQGLAKPYVRRWVNIDTTQAGNLAAFVVDEGRFLHAKRLGCALGGAAGMAAIFDAPVGGLLYMLEEVTEASWTSELTLRTIVGTVLCVFMNRALVNLSGKRITDFLIYVTGSQEVNWTWKDLPFFVILAVVLGVSSCGFTHMLTAAFRFRQRLGRVLKRCHPFGKIGECAFHAAVCALVFCLASWAGGCQSIDSAGAPVQSLQRFHCPDGEFAPVAELLLQGSEESIKLFYTAANDGRMEYSALAIVLVTYATLFVGTLGLAIPIGTFIPAMFVGGLIGRFVGKFLYEFPIGLAAPHIYAVVGSAAMLSAFTRQTLAIVVFLIECVNDLHLIPPLMLTIFVSHRVADCLCPESLDEKLIELKGVPFLEHELPAIVERRGAMAADLCDDLPLCAVLPSEASVDQVQRALNGSQANIFPIVSGTSCVGLATRPRLQAALHAIAKSDMGSDESSSSDSRRICHGVAGARERRDCGSNGMRCIPEESWGGGAEVTDGEIDHMISSMLGQDATPRSRGTEVVTSSTNPAMLPEQESHERTVPLPRLMDAAPYTVLENMPAPRIYPLFTRLGIRAVCVLSTEGTFRGVISRDGLIAHIQSYHHESARGAHPFATPCCDGGEEDWERVEGAPRDAEEGAAGLGFSSENQESSFSGTNSGTLSGTNSEAWMAL